MISATFLTMASAVLAAAVPVAEIHQNLFSTDPHINIMLYHDKLSSKTSLTILDEHSNKLFGHTCSNSISTGNFANLPIAVDLNENDDQSGTLIYGTETYPFSGNSTDSSNLSCHVIPRETSVFVNCLIRWTAGFEPVEIDRSSAEICFGGNGLDKRQTPCGIPTLMARKVGNGNPHVNYFHKQLSETMSCAGASTCTVGYAQTTSFTVGWSASISNPAGWITGGFEVQQSYSSGNNYECQVTSGSVCNWYKYAHTAFTVENYWFQPGCISSSAPVGSPYIIFAPNKCNWAPNVTGKRSGHYCRTGTNCLYKGASFWVKDGDAVTPPAGITC